jgi:hypothetical protein
MRAQFANADGRPSRVLNGWLDDTDDALEGVALED